jgi:PAS domain S-box-containing protein
MHLANDTVGLRVLIVEDEALIAEEILDRLGRLGYNVVGVADNADDAIAQAAEQRPDIVLMDISIKGAADGIETAACIYGQFNIPVVFLTAHSDDATFQRAMSTASFGYVLKPFHERDLLASVKVALHRHRAELHLRDSELTYATIAESMADGIIAVDADACVRYMNPAGEALTGAPLGVSLGQPLEQVLLLRSAGESEERIAAVKAALLQGGALVGAIWTVEGGAGKATPVEANVAPVRSVSGNITGAVVTLHDISERQRQNVALRESEERWHYALDGSDDGVWDWNAETDVVYFSPAWKELLGFADDEISGTYEDWRSRVHPDDLPGALACLEAHFSGRVSSITHEHRLRCKDGSYKWILARGRAVTWKPDGKPLRVVGTHSDITSIKEAMQTLEESESRFRALIDDLEVGVLLHDEHDRIVLTNRAAQRMLGVIAEEVNQVTSRDQRWSLIQEDGSAYPIEEVPSIRAARTGEVVRNQVVGVASLDTGERRWLLVTAAPRLATDGRLLHVLVSIVDITAQKRVEQDLRASKDSVRLLNERFVLAAEAAGIGVWEFEFATNGIVWDDQMHRLYEVPLGEFGGSYEVWLGRIHPEDLPKVNAAVQRAVSKDEPVNTEVRLVLPKSRLRYVRAFARVQRDENGAPLRMIGVNYDVTQQRLLEQQVLQGHKMQAIGQLAGGVAHDFNNLLTVICGYSEMMLSDFMEPEHPLRAYVEAMHDAGERAARLTQQLLLFSRKAEQKPEVFDINNLLRDIQKMLRRLIEENITIEVELAPGLHSVSADRSQMEQIVLNLSLNARDAMPQGGTLSIRTYETRIDGVGGETEQAAKPGEFVVLQVRDTGIGMTPETKSRVFEPFFTTKGRGHGTGLGLATVYGVVEQSGGFIQVESLPGKGSDFLVYIPFATASGDSPAALMRQGAKSGRGEVVLLVEDEHEVRRIGRLILEQAGYIVVEAADADQAERRFAECGGAIDLLITDVVMPGRSGRQLAEDLRAKSSELRVLFVSGYNEDAILRQGIQDTSANFLSKPYSHAGLTKKVREALDVRVG